MTVNTRLRISGPLKAVDSQIYIGLLTAWQGTQKSCYGALGIGAKDAPREKEKAYPIRSLVTTKEFGGGGGWEEPEHTR